MTKALSSAQWHEIGRRIFVSWGAAADSAECVARSLVESDLAGFSSHGVLRIASYYGHWQAGWLNPTARAAVVSEGPAMALVDGHWGFGQPAMHTALDLAIAKSRTQGVAGVGLIHSGHIGRLGEYAEKAAAAETMCLVAASGGPAGGLVVPYGGSQRVLCTNPIATGTPAGEHPPFIMDYATSVVAAGKLELAPDKDMPIPEGWAVAANGSPAKTLREFLEGGGLLPFGGHKGYALSLFIELLCGGLTGAGLSERPDRIPTFGLGGNAAFAIVFDIARFTDLGQFKANVDAFMGRLKRVKPAQGFQEIIIPGEPEVWQRAIHAVKGISVADATWEQIATIARDHGAKLDDIL
jgi:LDH2 family malate/lactate/ureidoglycolate dehydrogenase